MVEIMRQSVIVMDDFYDNPEEIRELALKAGYLDGGTYPGKDSRDNLFTPEVMRKISSIVGAPIQPFENSGNFRLSLEGDTASRHIHIDGFNTHVANVCLALDKDIKGGLAFWKHKETGIEYVGGDKIALMEKTGMTLRQIEENFVLKDGQDESLWEQTALIPYRFNRCIIIDGRFFHSPWPQGYGDSPENGRLSQHFFFRSAL
jgi:hypothetical protein